MYCVGEKPIVYQLDNAPDNDTLTVIAWFAVLSSLQNICIEQYKMLNSQSMNDNNFILTIRQICCNIHNLETITIEFTSPHWLFDSTMLEELADIKKTVNSNVSMFQTILFNSGLKNDRNHDILFFLFSYEEKFPVFQIYLLLFLFINLIILNC